MATESESLAVNASSSEATSAEGQVRHDRADDRLPILIGITGKRELSPEQTQSVEARLRTTFKQLDIDYPHVPKVLLTGGAYGADTIAAEIVLNDPAASGSFAQWSVTVLLPYELALFEKDFRPTDTSEAAARIAEMRLMRLRALTANQARVQVRTLPRLAGARGSDQVDSLDKDAGAHQKTLRHQHYEQVGQLIAQTATILVAVMDGSEVARRSEADGGTARVVAFRRAGRPDPIGMDVARSSAVLRTDWGTLVDPPAGHAWLIEPKRPTITGRYPIAVLAPSLEKLGREAYENPAVASAPTKAEQLHALHVSGVIPKAFERFNRALLESGERNAKRKSSASSTTPPFIDRFDRYPLVAMKKVSKTISELQGRAKMMAERAFLTVSILFALAVLTLEVFAKFFSDSPIVLGVYVALLAMIFGVLLWGRRNGWQALTEDYRAVAEMLRVQDAWWSCGRSERVDHLHMQSVDPELARIREAARTIIGWIWLRSQWPTALPVENDWRRVRGRACEPRTPHGLREADAPGDWVGSQLRYFARTHRAHHKRLRRRDAVTWALFAASGWLAAILLLWLSAHEAQSWFAHVAKLARWLPSGAADASALVVWAGLATLLVFLWSLNAGREDPDQPARTKFDLKNPALTTAVALLVAGLASFAIQSGAAVIAAAEAGSHTVEHSISQMLAAIPRAFAEAAKSEEARAEVGHVAQHLAVLVFVTLSAVAGAVRYVTEKLGLEAQALQYRDTLKRFAQAERLLAPGACPRTGAPADITAAQQIIIDLGMVALEENEMWLEARRERPLSPVVG